MPNNRPTTPAIPLPTARTHPVDPPPALARLRADEPLCRLRYPDGHVGWLATSHALGRAILSDPRFSVRPERSPVVASAAPEDTADEPRVPGVLMLADPPQHSRLRRAVAGHFTVRAVQDLRPRVSAIVTERLDAMTRAGSPCDLMEEFALPVPSLALCVLLGVPPGDRHTFERLTAEIQDPESTPEKQAAAFDEFSGYIRGVLDHKHAQPSDDLLSALLAAGELTDDELVGMAYQLFTAGHDTTGNMLGLSVYVLLHQRHVWESLRVEPSGVDAAVEELLRYATLVQTGSFSRTATDDVEIGGVTITAGESVIVSLSAANRDPDKFAEPDRLDPTRKPTGHLAFGHGIHMCLGQHLARLELGTAISGLIERFPYLQLAVPAEDVVLHGGDHQLYGPVQLPVAWTEE